MLLNRGNNSFGTTGGSVNFSTAAYWRFQVDAMNTDTYVGWTDIKFYDMSNVLITTTGQTYSEGGAGAQGAHGASAPFDASGNSTYWLRSGAPSWVQIQFGSAIKPSKFDFTIEALARAPINFRIQSSTNGTVWTDELIIWEPSWDALNALRTWPQSFIGKYKAIGFEVSAIQGGAVTGRMSDAEFHATVAGADLTTGGQSFCSTNTGTGTVPASLWDNSNATEFDWTSAQLPGSIYYAFPTTIAPPAEATLTANVATANSWKDFKIYGTNDGVTKVYLKTVTGENWTAIPQTKPYSIP